MVAMGCYSAMPIIVCWFNMNLGGHHRRSVGSAWQVAFGNIGGEFVPHLRLDYNCLPHSCFGSTPYSSYCVARSTTNLACTTGIIAVFAFLKKDAPKYITGYSICLAFTSLSILSCILYFFACSIQNRNRDKTAVDVGLTQYEKTEMGDLNPEYRYLL